MIRINSTKKIRIDVLPFWIIQIERNVGKNDGKNVLRDEKLSLNRLLSTAEARCLFWKERTKKLLEIIEQSAILRKVTSHEAIASIAK